jgi:hypothetical protein
MSVDELQKAMRGAANRKLAAGVEPRDHVARGLAFQERPAAPRFLIVAAVLLVLLIAGLMLSYLAKVPPAHILIIALGLFWLFGWRIFKRRKV